MKTANEYPKIINNFLSYKRNVQNRSALTVKNYANDLEMFFTFIYAKRENRDFDDIENIDDVDVSLVETITSSDIFAFLYYLSDTRKVCAKTRARKLSAIKAFFKYCSAVEHSISSNPAREIDSPSVRPALPRFLTLDESIELLNSVDRKEEFYFRDFCILTLFLNCGMRLSELVGINISDIDDDFSKMRVTGKGNKMRIIYLNDACESAIRDYLPVRREMSERCAVKPDKDARNALFLSKRNRRISRESVQKLVQKYLGLAGLGGKGFSVHKLRHTAATLMYSEGGVDVRTLKEVLGHEQLNTTQIYTHVSDKSLKKAMDSNPLAHGVIKKKNDDD